MIMTHLAPTRIFRDRKGRAWQNVAAFRAILMRLGGAPTSIEPLNVNDGMRFSGNHPQVLNAIIVFDPVNVVDEFRGEESSPEKHPHNVSMFENKSPVHGYLLVALGGECTLSRRAANKVDVPVSFESLIMLAAQLQGEKGPAASHNCTYFTHVTPPVSYYNISYMSCQGDLFGL